MTMPMHDQQYCRRQRRKRYVFIAIALLLIVELAVFWVPSPTGLPKGSWSAVFVVIFTVFSLLLALFQVLLATPGVPERSVSLQIPDITLGLNKRTEAVIVHTKRDLRGATINLHCGFLVIVTWGQMRLRMSLPAKGEHVVFVSVFPLFTAWTAYGLHRFGRKYGEREYSS